MRRFYRTVTVHGEDAGWRVRLDARPLGTPERRALVLPSARLADAIATEWAGQGDSVDPAAMPMTGIANAAIDRVAPAREQFVADVARYGESDLACYRAETPTALVAAEAAAWDPLLRWARDRYDAALQPVSGVMHMSQPAAAVARLTTAVAALDHWTLAALAKAVPLSGSLVAGLMLADAGPDAVAEAERLWPALTVDELWQEAQWGSDAHAERNRRDRERDWLIAARFIALVAPVGADSDGNSAACADGSLPDGGNLPGCDPFTT